MITPLKASFMEDGRGWMAVDVLIDVVFLIDIVMTFFSAYYNGIEKLVINRR